MNEKLLSYIWKHKLFVPEPRTHTGELLQIHFPGTENHDAGPDFKEAVISINQQQWYGHVEIHVRSSDWEKHRHQHDENYRNVILHVVYEHDREISEPPHLPVLELKKIISPYALARYTRFANAPSFVPCENSLKNISDSVILSMLQKTGQLRLEKKTAVVLGMLHQVNGNWEETLYRLLLQNFGFKTNAYGCERLGASLPWSVLRKHTGNLTQLEALMLGQAGLLSVCASNDYVHQLQNEYAYLSAKYKLTPLPAKVWKFLRMRPANFPTIRLAQFAGMLHGRASLLSTLLDEPDVAVFIRLLHVKPSAYWNNHYVPGKESAVRSKPTGIQAINLLLINTFIPLLRAFGTFYHRDVIIKKADNWFAALSPEQNKITYQWGKLGLVSRNATDSQALLELKKNWCDNRQCLHCDIGKNILQEPSEMYYPMALQA